MANARIHTFQNDHVYLKQTVQASEVHLNHLQQQLSRTKDDLHESKFQVDDLAQGKQLLITQLPQPWMEW